MNAAIIPSTLLLTVLLAVGLFFFIRASVKDRTQQVQLFCEQAEDDLIVQLEQYFTQRAYRVAALHPGQNQVTFEGIVQPSIFLAVFLTILATSGTLCLALVLSMLVPNLAQSFLGLVLFAPLAGVFYWQKARRSEQVSIQVESLPVPKSLNLSLETKPQSQITVTAHRDEIAELQKTLALKNKC